MRTGQRAECSESNKLMTWVVFGLVCCLCGAIAGLPATAQDVDELTSSHHSEIRQQSLKTVKIQGALAALNDAWPDVQAYALEALDDLYALDQISPHHVSSIATLLDHQNEDVRLTVIRVLGKLGEPAEEVLSQIGAFLEHPNAELRAAAVTAIGRLGAGQEDIDRLQVVRLLDDSDLRVRMATVNALRKLDPSAQTYLPHLQQQLASQDPIVRAEALMMFGGLGETAEAYVPQLVSFLEDSHIDVQKTAVTVLGDLGIPDARVMAQIAELFQHENVSVRVTAVKNLCRIRPLSQPYLAELVALLQDDEADVRAAVISGLGKLADDAQPHLSAILDRIDDSAGNVRVATIEVISTLGNAAPYVDLLVERLDDSEWDVRAAAARTLGSLGEVARPALPHLVQKFDDPDWFVRSHAIKAFGALVSTDEQEQKRLLRLLHDDDGNVRAAVTWVLGNWEERARPYLPQLLDLLQDPHQGVRYAAGRALRNLGEVPLDVLLAIVNPLYDDTQRTAELRFLAHSAGAGRKEAEVLLQWVGRPATPVSLESVSRAQARTALMVFRTVENARFEASHVVTHITEQSKELIAFMRPRWHVSDLEFLRRHVAYLGRINSSDARVARMTLWFVRGRWLLKDPVFQGILLGVLHPLFWIVLLGLYPHARLVRVIFFWNPYVRWILGAGYVHFALLHMPFLRQRLFSPFAHSLIADATLECFDDYGYVKELEVSDSRMNATLPIHKAIPELRGKIVLEGPSGFGKSMFARYLMKYAIRPTVYLPAEKCTNDMVEAVLVKLHGEVHDRSFLRRLICAGAIDVCVDGLDSISTTHRARVSQFLVYACAGNVLVTTRSTEWLPHTEFTAYRIQALTLPLIEEMLHRNYRLLPKDVAISSAEYRLRCDAFLERMTGTNDSEDMASLPQEATCPMNLSLVGLLCAYGKTPELKILMKQCYQLVTERYQQHNDEQPFPLVQFSERIYRMRLNDESVLPQTRFVAELTCLNYYNMVLQRNSFDGYGNPVTEWFFRHEKIMEFFIAQAFLNSHGHSIDRHIGDSRFHGVYAILKAIGHVSDEILQSYSLDIPPGSSMTRFTDTRQSASLDRHDR